MKGWEKKVPTINSDEENESVSNVNEDSEATLQLSDNVGGGFFKNNRWNLESPMNL